MGSIRHVVRLENRRTMPWRNGGGVTHELWKEGDGACGFAVRLSIAEVYTDGPFSTFIGVDRVIGVLRGRGFRLTLGGTDVTIDGARLYAFAGEEPCGCTLIDGPVLDLNVMTDRATRRARVEHRGPGVVRARWLLALGDGPIAGVDLRFGELIELDGAASADVPTIAIDVDRISG